VRKRITKPKYISIEEIMDNYHNQPIKKLLDKPDNKKYEYVDIPKANYKLLNRKELDHLNIK